MPSNAFSGKSKEDLVVVASISGLLNEKAASRMTKSALIAFLEAEQTKAEQAKVEPAQVEKIKAEPARADQVDADTRASSESPVTTQPAKVRQKPGRKAAHPEAQPEGNAVAESSSPTPVRRRKKADELPRIPVFIEVAPPSSIEEPVERPARKPATRRKMASPEVPAATEVPATSSLTAPAPAARRPGRKKATTVPAPVETASTGAPLVVIENPVTVQSEQAIIPAQPEQTAGFSRLEQVEAAASVVAATTAEAASIATATNVATSTNVAVLAGQSEIPVPAGTAMAAEQVPVRSRQPVTRQPHKRPEARPTGRPSAKAAQQEPFVEARPVTQARPSTPPTSTTPATRPYPSHRDRAAHLPGFKSAAHHQLIPAHHTLTSPNSMPDEQSRPAEGSTPSVMDDQTHRQFSSAGAAQPEQSTPIAPSPAIDGTARSVRPETNAAPSHAHVPGEPRPSTEEGSRPQPAELPSAEGALTSEGELRADQSQPPRVDPEHAKRSRPFVESGEMVAGVLEIMPDGYGFLRKDNYLQGSHDIYVPPQYIRRFNLRPGDWVVGPGKSQRDTDRYQALLYIKEVNGLPPDKMIRRPQFDKLTPIYPEERFVLETSRNELSTRIIDLVAPIGKGQRGMIVSPPKAGKTILLQKIANAISVNNPDSKLIVLLIDERPEEVTDMQRSINGEVVYSTFDKTPENHVKVTELVLERAMRLVELKQDVVILLDSITRMGRAYNLTINPTGRTLSGGLDPGALYGPKRFFGAARNIEGGGSLTIVATALIDTGSRMDEVIFEEFKGTGNMEVYLDRKLSEKRIFPAIDINRSGTRREELLLTTKELDAVWAIRKAFSQLDTAAVTEMIINLLLKTNNNQHFVSSINVSLNDKNIFEAMRGSRTGAQAQNQAQNGHSG